MRWFSKDPKPGTVRLDKKFLILPKKLPLYLSDIFQWRWLERATVLYVFDCNGHFWSEASWGPAEP